MLSIILSVLAAVCTLYAVLALVQVIRAHSWTRNPFIRGHRRIMAELEFRRLSLVLAVFGAASAVLWAAAILTKGL